MIKKHSPEKWIDQINDTLDRLALLNCDKCISEWLNALMVNGTIFDYTQTPDAVTYQLEETQYLITHEFEKAENEAA